MSVPALAPGARVSLQPKHESNHILPNRASAPPASTLEGVVDPEIDLSAANLERDRPGCDQRFNTTRAKPRTSAPIDKRCCCIMLGSFKTWHAPPIMSRALLEPCADSTFSFLPRSALPLSFFHTVTSIYNHSLCCDTTHFPSSPHSLRA